MDFEIVVIGASTAGLYAAEQLAKNGKRVALFERLPELSTDSRTYIITPGLFRVFPDLNRRLIRQRIDRFQLFAGGSQAEISLAEPDLVVDRRQLLENLEHRARSAGVEIYFDSIFTGWAESQHGNQVRMEIAGKEQAIKADFLIGADGTDSRIRAAAGLPPVLKVPLLQAEIQLPASWPEGVCGVWFDVSQTRFFYWLIPDRDRRGVVGLITDAGSDIRSALELFLTSQGIKALRFQSGQAAYYLPGLANEFQKGEMKVMLLGDAAGQVKVSTIGGCVTGLRGAAAGVQAITNGIPYRQACRELNRELHLHFFIRQLLQRMTAEEYIQLMDYLNNPVRTFLGSRDRDQMRRQFWKLVFLQPGFIPLGLRLFLRR